MAASAEASESADAEGVDAGAAETADSVPAAPREGSDADRRQPLPNVRTANPTHTGYCHTTRIFIAARYYRLFRTGCPSESTESAAVLFIRRSALVEASFAFDFVRKPRAREIPGLANR